MSWSGWGRSPRGWSVGCRRRSPAAAWSVRTARSSSCGRRRSPRTTTASSATSRRSSSPARARRSARSSRCPACRPRSSGAGTGRCSGWRSRSRRRRPAVRRPRRRCRRGRATPRRSCSRRRSTRSTSPCCGAAATRSGGGRSTTASSCRRTRRRCSTSTPSRSPVFMAARFDASRAAALGQQTGDGTPIMLTIPTDRPWVPLRILGLGAEPDRTIDADVFLLTDDRPQLLAGGPGLRPRAQRGRPSRAARRSALRQGDGVGARRHVADLPAPARRRPAASTTTSRCRRTRRSRRR